MSSLFDSGETGDQVNGPPEATADTDAAVVAVSAYVCLTVGAVMRLAYPRAQVSRDPDAASVNPVWSQHARCNGQNIEPPAFDSSIRFTCPEFLYG
ncbi:hypothetical protein [Streptomyces sp. NPDC087297]|uniref:hypothetical protein n=1 Tax=Streptomyces sp. NPDC087297 TaxID=3365778 RepID=UPI003824F8CA